MVIAESPSHTRYSSALGATAAAAGPRLQWVSVQQALQNSRQGKEDRHTAAALHTEGFGSSERTRRVHRLET